MTADQSTDQARRDGRAGGEGGGPLVPLAGPDGAGSNGHGGPLTFADLTVTRTSRLLQYLPAIYSVDEFAPRFLCIFEDTLDPLEELVADLPYYFDPATAPPALLDWMAQWVGLEDVATWPLAERRTLVLQAVRIYQGRGTPQSLKLHLEALCTTEPLIIENSDGLRLGADARLGYNTSIGQERPRYFTVTIVVADPSALDVDLIQSIIETEKPVDTAYILNLRPRRAER